MKFILSREDFLPALQAVNNVVERRQSLPILSNILINADKDVITLTATDMEVELSFEIHTAVDTVGSATLPARKLLDICRALPAESDITVQLQGDKARVQSRRSRFILATLPAQEFPNIGSFDELLSCELDAALLSRLVESTQFAMAHQDVRYYLNGLLLEFSENQIRAVATDGHRLAMCVGSPELAMEGTQSLIVPRKGVTEVARMLGGASDTVNVVVGANHIRFSVRGQELTTKLIDGRFPDYERVIPREGDKRVIANRELLRAGLGRASILSNEKFRGVRITLSENTLTAIAHNPEQEEAEEEIEVQYSGGQLEIGFNVSYMLDVLGVLKAETVRMDFIDANSSCLLRHPVEEDACYVIMPMRL